MRGYVANTDHDWYTFLRARPQLDEVNFWQPSGGRGFRALSPGQPFFFKLKKPHYAIGGFGYFSHASRLPLSLAWDVFSEGNGAASYDEMRARVFRYRKESGDRRIDPEIGCLLISKPVFFEPNNWVERPADFQRQTVQGKGYDLRTGEGERIFRECLQRAVPLDLGLTQSSEDAKPDPRDDRYGDPTTIRPRLGQGAFRVAVLDAYGRSCAVTTEHSLPVLESAHIQPFAEGGPHAVSNGLLLRADIHRLYDRGFVTVTPDLRFRVGRRLKESWQNGRVYYDLDGKRIVVPKDAAMQPARKLLEWHGEERFLG